MGYPMRWTSQFSAVDKLQIIEIEETLGVVFPKDFSDILRQYPLGSSEDQVIDFGQFKEKVFAGLLNVGEPDDLITVAKSMRDALPENTVPFGTDPFGNLFCFRWMNSGEPQVVYWDHETYGRTEDIEKSVFFVATSWKEFLSKLYTPA
ncbi:MAG: hypothetical protein CVV45_17950 [Spirochaetae bacterium HGW-Spirochaetae-10]|nr:MAG: hypothetical protein CVV45_17950 [Spirochaetae bacterium HGW-Spirochaetae-10]